MEVRIQEMRKYMAQILDGKIEEEKLPRSLQDILEQIREDEKRAMYYRR